MRIVIGGEDEVAFRLAERLMTDHEIHFICPEYGLHEARLARMDVTPVFGPIRSAWRRISPGVHPAYRLWLAGICLGTVVCWRLPEVRTWAATLLPSWKISTVRAVTRAQSLVLRSRCGTE